MADNNLGFGMRDPSHRVEWFCDGCGQVTSDPRHSVGRPEGNTTDRHIDCCAAAGCPDGSCTEVLETAGDKRYDALVKHIAKGGADKANYTAKGA